MAHDDAVCGAAAEEHRRSPEADAEQWDSSGDAVALEQIAQRRRQVHAYMTEFIAIAKRPDRREQAQRLLQTMLPWVEGLYAIEDAVCGRGPAATAQRAAHQLILRELHTSQARLAAPAAARDPFDLVHAIDALLIHEWVVSREADALEPIVVREPQSVPAAAQERPRPSRPAPRSPAH